ncbi:MAG TPA: hypothetical protein VFA46_23025 [Actinomycetes bacterium]|nr:hypothetical protein [Actinomycetes bacterium]
MVQLQASERKLLQRMVRTPTAQYRQVLRAKIVLAAATGLTNAHIARRLGMGAAPSQGPADQAARAGGCW